jgi:hypothetical protein
MDIPVEIVNMVLMERSKNRPPKKSVCTRISSKVLKYTGVAIAATGIIILGAVFGRKKYNDDLDSEYETGFIDGISYCIDEYTECQNDPASDIKITTF